MLFRSLSSRPTRKSLIAGWVILTGCIGVSVLGLGSNSYAAPQELGPMLAYNPMPQQPGFENGKVLSGGAIWYSSPTLADLNGDNKQEIVIGGVDGMVYAVESDGNLLWEFNTKTALNAAAPLDGDSIIYSTPAVADLEGDGAPEVVVGLGFNPTGASIDNNGGVIVINANGTLKSGWPQLTLDFDPPTDTYTDGVFSSPVVGDLDGDGDLEVVAASFDMHVHIWHHTGEALTGWPRLMPDTIWSSPTLADLDRDGRLEIIIGSDAPTGGYIHVLRGNGADMPGFPKGTNQTIFSSPAIADLNNDGWLDIVVGSGNNFSGRGMAVYAWDRAGNPLPGWPVTTGSGGYTLSSPSVGDIDGDDQLEVVIGADDGKLYAFNGDGSRVNGWPVVMKDILETTGAIHYASPVLANFDDDALPEVFLNFYCDTMVLDGDGAFLTQVGVNDPLERPSMYVPSAFCLGTTPAVGDIDQDGKLEVVHGVAKGTSTGAAMIYVWESDRGEPTTVWPMFRRSPDHLAVYPTQAQPHWSLYLPAVLRRY
jgi:hypothetical protein